MPPEREGDFIAVADRYTAIGSRPDEHDLAGLTGHRLRSHGGGCGHRKSSATCDSSASAGGGHSVKASTGPADQCRHDVAMAIAHIAHAGRLAADGARRPVDSSSCSGGEQGEVVGIAEGIYATAQQYLRFVGSCDRPDAKKGVEIVDKKFKLEIIEVPGLPNLRNPHARAAARAIPRN
jgi:hypothetical protein